MNKLRRYCSEAWKSRKGRAASLETQGHNPEFASKRIEVFAGYAGWWSHTVHAEPFIRAKAETSEYLSVTPIDLRTARQTGQENLQRISQFASAQPGETGNQSRAQCEEP